ncbi:MAG: type II toxin-antitoxin system CcdA family antitoxin [Azonexus sp.]|jgi:antitoxin CcdA|nr:type II toxin-antitoxin system CcdA family antitoxin [Azonexus sp.]
MRLSTTQASPKRPVNLTLSETTVEQARQFTGNLSATVEALLAEFVAKESAAHNDKHQLYAQVAEAWNQFEATHGSFADEYSTL